MKTKFSAIVSLHKKDMQECERIIMQNENKINRKKFEDLYDLLLSCEDKVASTEKEQSIIYKECE